MGEVRRASAVFPSKHQQGLDFASHLVNPVQFNDLAEETEKDT